MQYRKRCNSHSTFPVPFCIMFLGVFLLLSCLSTPEVDEDATGTINENSESGSSGKSTKTTTTSSSDSDDTNVNRTSSNDNGPGLGNLFGINFTSFWGKNKSPAGEESIIYIVVYVALFCFIYLAIVLRIIRRRKK